MLVRSLTTSATFFVDDVKEPFFAAVPFVSSTGCASLCLTVNERNLARRLISETSAAQGDKRLSTVFCFQMGKLPCDLFVCVYSVLRA
jgi:hypothetical protein